MRQNPGIMRFAIGYLVPGIKIMARHPIYINEKLSARFRENLIMLIVMALVCLYIVVFS